MRLITQITSEREEVKLRSEQLLHDQGARVRSDVVVFGNGFIQIQLSAVDLHLHAAIIKSSHWCSTQRNICTETHAVYQAKACKFLWSFQISQNMGNTPLPIHYLVTREKQQFGRKHLSSSPFSLRSRSSQQS